MPPSFRATVHVVQIVKCKRPLYPVVRQVCVDHQHNHVGGRQAPVAVEVVRRQASDAQTTVVTLELLQERQTHQEGAAAYTTTSSLKHVVTSISTNTGKRHSAVFQHGRQPCTVLCSIP